VRAGQVGQDLVGVDPDDRAVPDVDGFLTGALVVFPRFERRPEERLDVVRPRSPDLTDDPLVDRAPLVVVHVERLMAELAHLRRPRAHLALLVDDRLVVLMRCGVQRERRPAVLERKHRRQVVVNEARPDLRLERIDVQLWMPVQKAMRRVPAVLVHGPDHEQAESGVHGCRIRRS
jgi:hypothetical protein